jgi:lipopolysaccharide/colanic/teichoic acid biosynthesis glycosyltransferase/predicted ATP-grasp superfamily ATP-dependent carboligase
MAGTSRYARSTERVPDPFVTPYEYARAIARIVSERQIEVVLPVHEDALILRQHEAELPPRVNLACPSLELLELVLDKGAFARFPFSRDVPLPSTRVPANLEEVEATLNRATYPLIVKTRRGNGGKGTLRLETREGAFQTYVAFAHSLGLDDSLPLIQDFISGQAIGACFLAERGQVQALFLERYLRCKESEFGTSVLRERVDLPSLEQAARRVVSELGYDGLGHMDFLVDASGQPWLLELNPRIWGALELSLANGFDFPAAYLDQLLGRPTDHHFQPVDPPQKALWLVGEGIALVGELAKTRSPLRLLESAKRVFARDNSFDDFKLDDPLPLLAEALHYGVAFIRTGGQLNPATSAMLGAHPKAHDKTQRSFYQRFGKRWIDFGLASTALVLLGPLLLLLAGLVAMSSGRPIFYVQMRVGRHGRLFPMYKFRTMVLGAETAGSITIADDPRTTRVGRFMRRFKLDELPQLWNVARGEMSFVGPRPDVPGFADQLRGEARKVLELLPGITGPATLRFANEEELLKSVSDPEAYNRDIIYPEKVRLNLKYAQEVSLEKDLAYLLQTVGLWPRQHS